MQVKIKPTAKTGRNMFNLWASNYIGSRES